MKAKNYIELMQTVLHYIEDGVHIIDKNSKTIIYNRAMANMEGMSMDDVIEKPFVDNLRDLSVKENSILKVLESGEKIENKKYTYLNKYGKEITTINTIMPIKSNDEIIGALKISKNITNIKELSDTILSLHKKISSPTNEMINIIKTYTFDNLIGENNDFKTAISVAEKSCNILEPILIYGETGTGKTLFSQMIHYKSDRKEKPFVVQNCSSVSKILLEEILFGVSKDGSSNFVDKLGIFELANEGTILLKDINHMALSTQMKVANILEEGCVRRIGSNNPIQVNVRIIATTSENPLKSLNEEKLKKDLYYRLNVIHIQIPSLKNRKDDLFILADCFIKKYNEKLNKKVKGISKELKEAMQNYDWIGNIRELENFIYSAMILMDEKEETINVKQVPYIDYMVEKSSYFDGNDLSVVKAKGLSDYIESTEKDIIFRYLKENNNNISKTAKILKIKRQTLQHKLKKYNE